VGIGGDPATATKDGAFMILNAHTLDILHEDRKAKLWITDIKYSPSGRVFVLASKDGCLYAHHAETFALLKTMKAHSSGAGVMHFDFSADGNVIRACAVLYELYFLRVSDGELISNGNTVRDVEWHTATSIYGWNVKGAALYAADLSRF
jgi:WD40 repeat protein